MTTNKIAFQGELGAYGHQACADAYPDMEPLPCGTFADAIEAVRRGDADLGMIGVENSTYGRVADVHQLLPDSGLHIVAEAFVRVRVNLLGVAGAQLSDIKQARSMSILLGQCRSFLTEHGIAPLNWSDNARAARDVAALGDSAEAALASEIAAQIYGLDILARGIEDNTDNTTRFLVMSRTADLSRRGKGQMKTALVFRTRNIPAALYKALGGFATNAVNMTKLESYRLGAKFKAAQFYAEIDGHPEDKHVALALEELDFFTDHLKVMGVFPAAPIPAD